MKHLKIVALFAAIVSIEQLSYTRDPHNIHSSTQAVSSYYSPTKISLIDDSLNRTSNDEHEILVENLSNKHGKSKNELTDGSQPANYLYSKKINDSNPAEVADRLIEESYVTPAMQWAILSFFEQPFIYNKITGAPVIFDKITNNPRDWFTIQEILANVTLSKLSTVSKTTTINALQAAIQAIDIAVEVAKLEAGYDANKQSYYFYQNADKQITENLYRKKLGLEAMLARVQNAHINGPVEAFNYTVAQLDNKDFMMLSPDEVTDLINTADFKTKAEHPAAQLLFKQCFMAQRHHTKSKIRLENITKAQDLNEETIYRKFPTMSNLISIAKEMPTKPEQHALLTDIRKSVQTALYIAKKEYQKVYHLRTDPLVQALKDMDAQVKAVWIDREYGATPDDLSRDAMWTNLTNAAIGAGAVVGTVGAGLFVYDSYQDPDKLKYATEVLMNQLGNMKNGFVDTLKNSATSISENLITPTGKALGSIIPRLPDVPDNIRHKYEEENQLKVNL